MGHILNSPSDKNGQADPWIGKQEIDPAIVIDGGNQQIQCPKCCTDARHVPKPIPVRHESGIGRPVGNPQLSEQLADLDDAPFFVGADMVIDVRRDQVANGGTGDDGNSFLLANGRQVKKRSRRDSHESQLIRRRMFFA